MGFRFPRFATGLLVASAVVLTTSLSWAVYYDLGPSPDEWGLKYTGDVTATSDGKLNVSFTLADPGRLKPIHSVHIFALSNPDRNGSRTYLLKAPMALKPMADGKMTGQLQISRDLGNVAVVRIFSYTVDGKAHTTGPMAGVRYYDIPIRKFVKPVPLAAPYRAPAPIASPPALKATR